MNIEKLTYQTTGPSGKCHGTFSGEDWVGTTDILIITTKMKSRVLCVQLACLSMYLNTHTSTTYHAAVISMTQYKQRISKLQLSGLNDTNVSHEPQLSIIKQVVKELPQCWYHPSNYTMSHPRRL